MSAAPMPTAAERAAERVAAVTGWLLLAFGGARLAVPRREAAEIALAAEIRRLPHGTPAGRLTTESGEFPVYALDARLGVLDHIPERYHFCVALEYGGRRRALACEAVALLHNDEDVSVQQIPAGLFAPGAPLNGVALLDEQLVCTAHAADLIAYLPEPEVPHDA